MTTTVVRTIGTGGDYSVPQSWEDASPANLVTLDQIWEGQMLETFDPGLTACVSFSGSTTNSTCYKHLTVAAGLSFQDNPDKDTSPLTYNAAAGVCIIADNITDDVFKGNETYSKVSRLQIEYTSSASVGVARNSNGGTTLLLADCIIEYRGINIILRSVSAENCLINAASGAVQALVRSDANPCVIKNCTFVYGASTMINGAFWNAGPAITITDSALFTNTPFSNGAITISRCYGNNVYAGVTVVPYDTGSGSGFVSITEPYDFRLLSSSSLINATTEGINPDILLNIRPSGGGYDVGCVQYIGGGGAVDHHTSGSIIGSGADTTGSADHRPTSVTHSSGGNIVGKTSDVTGASSSFSKLTSSGALLGDFGTITGTSTRFRAHPAVGALLGDFGTVTGAADQSSPVGEHDVEGDIVAGTGTVTGQSHSVGYRPTTGAIVGNTGVIAGTAKHIKMHATHGDPIGAGSIVVGTASRSDPVVDHGTFGEIDGYQAELFGNATHSKMTLTQADIDAIVAGIVAAIIPVNIVRVNHIDVDGTGADSDPWGPV